MRNIFVLMAICFFNTNAAYAVDPCHGSADRDVCLHMNSLRSQIHALDAQRELMQSNPIYIEALGHSLNKTALDTLKILKPGIPEHRTGLSSVAQLADNMAAMAAKNDPRMLTLANQVRVNCATCHANANPPSGVDWDAIFNNDWTKISEYCNNIGKNPYFCKSMNGMLSAFSYHFTAHNAQIKDYALTEQAAGEIARILVDIKEKGFRHLPDKARDDAEAAAREVMQLASNKDPLAFEKARSLNSACIECHNQRSHFDDIELNGSINPKSLRKSAFKK